MYNPGALTFMQGKDSVPLLVDHNDDRAIGVVHTIMRFDDTDGPWLAAVGEVTDLPSWLRRDTKASFSYKAANTSHDVLGCGAAHR